MRPSIQETLLEIAATVSKRATCSRRQNGAVIADSKGVVLSTGYNGSLSGMQHCNHECDCDDEFIVERLVGYSEKVDNRDLHTETCPAHPNNGCKLAVHAEANAIYFAARNGIRTQDSIIYCTTEPCTKCAEAIVQSGIIKVVYRQEYRDHSGLELLNEAYVVVERLE